MSTEHPFLFLRRSCVLFSLVLTASVVSRDHSVWRTVSTSVMPRGERWCPKTSLRTLLDFKDSTLKIHHLFRRCQKMILLSRRGEFHWHNSDNNYNQHLIGVGIYDIQHMLQSWLNLWDYGCIPRFIHKKARGRTTVCFSLSLTKHNEVFSSA